MRRLDADEVRWLARLAGLRLDEKEVERLAGELTDILAHFEALPSVEEETEGGGETDERPLPARGCSPLREDVPGSDRLRRPPESAAPLWRDGFFVVPRLPGLGEGNG